MWLHKQALPSPRQASRDVTGILGTGLGALNDTDSEVLMSKFVTTTNDLNKPKHPLQSSFLV